MPVAWLMVDPRVMHARCHVRMPRYPMLNPCASPAAHSAATTSALGRVKGSTLPPSVVPAFILSADSLFLGWRGLLLMPFRVVVRLGQVNP